MKLLIVNDIRIDGRHRRAGETIELDCIPGILSGDLKPLPETHAPRQSAPSPSAPRPVHKNKPPLWRVGIFVTGRCNMNCAHCSQKEFRADHGDMELETVEKVCAAVKKSGREMIFSVTGGEPTLWPHLHRSFEIASDAGCFPESWLFSNGTECSQIETLIKEGLLTYYNTNAANCNSACHELKKKYPKNVRISEGGHYPLIKKQVWNSIPASCNCPGVAVQGSRVWACPNFYSLIKRHKFDMELYQKEWSRSIDEDWISFFAENENKKFTSRPCMYCEENKKCQEGIAQSEKVRRYSRGI